jgi:hypothetical protein
VYPEWRDGDLLVNMAFRKEAGYNPGVDVYVNVMQTNILEERPCRFRTTYSS